nr:ATP-grasp ribosomal peptide maturase [Microbispora rosea]
MLVLTCLDDPTADMVIAQLNKRGAHVARVDPGADFPSEASFTTRYDQGGHGGYLTTTSRHVDLDTVRAVYYRRPTPYLPDDASSQIERFAATQWRYGLGGVLASLPCRYVNHPWRILAAEHKPLQLVTALRVGFTIPPTLITSSLADTRAFLAEHERVIYKPLRLTEYTPGGTPATIWATPVDPAALDETVTQAPHLFQQVVDKAADLRVTVAGNHVFCVRITSPLLDWRRDYDQISYALVDPPAGLAAACHAYLRELGLTFGAFDFALTADDAPVFLECNPNGQWGWLEEATGAPIAGAIADLLMEDHERRR